MMILNNVDIARYKLPTECEGAIFKYQKQREGANIICPKCETVLGKAQKVDMVIDTGKISITKFTSLPPNMRSNFSNNLWSFLPNEPILCPHCGIKGMLKGGTPTGHYFARLILRDGRAIYSATKLNLKSDKPNTERLQQVLLGRIRTALKTNRQFYWGRSRTQRKEHQEI